MRPSQEKDALTKRFDRAKKREDTVKLLLERARRPYREGQIAARAGDGAGARAKYAATIERLSQARALTKCARPISVLDRNIAKVKARLKGLAASPGKGNGKIAAIAMAAIDACNFTKAESELAQLATDSHLHRRLKARLTEVKAGDAQVRAENKRAGVLYRAGRAAERAGDTVAARSKYNQAAAVLSKALGETPCERYRTNLNTNLRQVRKRLAALEGATLRRRAQSACARRYENSVPTNIDPVTGSYICDCPQGYMWSRNRNRCLSRQALAARVRRLCASRYPGSVLGTFDATNYRCVCPAGARWNKDGTRCIRR